MPRGPEAVGFHVSMTKEQLAAFKAMGKDLSKLVRDLIREKMDKERSLGRPLPEFPPDAPPGYELATKARLEKKRSE